MTLLITTTLNCRVVYASPSPLASPNATSAQSIDDAKVGQLKQSMSARANSIYTESKTVGASPTVQNLSNAAFYFCLANGDNVAIEHLIRTEFGAQMMKDTYPSFGDLPWQINNSDVTNPNALILGCQAIAPILAGYDARLSPEFKEWFKPHIAAAMLALRKRNVSVKNTSMCLMKAVDLILIGQATYDGDSIYAGTMLLDRWIAYTKQSGIHEFCSPTSYETDLNSLCMGYLLSSDKLTKSKFKAILDYFWQDISVHYLPDTGLTGAHSKDYDLLHGAGGIDVYATFAGLNRLPISESTDLAKTFALLNFASPNGYRAPKRFLESSKIIPRTIEARWDDFPADDRYTYISRSFSLGSANGGDYGPQDKMFVAQFISKKNLPNIIYTTNKSSVQEKTIAVASTSKNSPLSLNGHEKSNAVIVQSQNKLLGMLDIDASKVNENDELTTDFIIPAQADSIAWHKSSETDVTGVSIQEGSSAIAIRIFQADSANGAPAGISISCNEKDRADGIVRLRINQNIRLAKQETKQTIDAQHHLKLGFLVIAEDCKTAEQLKTLTETINAIAVEQKVNDTGWQVKAQMAGTLLTANRDYANPKETTRFVNRIEVLAPVFSVNGTLLGPSMWHKEDALLHRQNTAE